MSNVVFDDNIKTCLDYALRMKNQGASEVARYLFECLAVSAGKVEQVDVLRLFYGDMVYGEVRNHGNALSAENTVIKDEKDVMAYAFVAKCAMEAYKLISTKSPARSETNAWATRGDNSDPRIIEFFQWLKKSNRRVIKTDSEYFMKFCMAVQKGATCKMSESVADKPLRIIVENAVRGILNISPDGELS